MITATKKSWIAVKYKNWLRLCGIVLVVVVVIVVVWVIRALVTEGWGSDCPGRAGGGGFGRCRKRSGKVGNVGGASEARRDEEEEEEEEEEEGRGSSRRRLVGWWLGGNGDVARKLGEPEESGEDEDAYVGT